MTESLFSRIYSKRSDLPTLIPAHLCHLSEDGSAFCNRNGAVQIIDYKSPSPNSPEFLVGMTQEYKTFIQQCEATVDRLLIYQMNGLPVVHEDVRFPDYFLRQTYFCDVTILKRIPCQLIVNPSLENQELKIKTYIYISVTYVRF